MATCSNGHSNIEDQVYCRECAASLVALNRGLLAHNPTEGMRQQPRHALPGRTSARRLPPTAVGLLVAVIAAAICVAVTIAVSDSHAPIRGHVLWSACGTFRAARSIIGKRSGGRPRHAACTARY